ncbi:MAG: hypothetical protein QOF35_1417 [Actinomycetota bacterium]|jgi:hypothetical protein|nr:hypothetical protein [Actinomycetota bacterium]
MVSAAVSAVAGAALLILWGAKALPFAVLVCGALLMAFGVVVVLAAALAHFRVRQTVVLNIAGITVRNLRGQHTLMWSDIQQVTLNGVRLTLVTAGQRGPSAELLNPGGHSEPIFAELLASIRTSLDADRGYRSM